MGTLSRVESFLKGVFSRAHKDGKNEHNQPPPQSEAPAVRVVKNESGTKRSHVTVKGDRLRRMNIQGFTGRGLV